MANHEIRRTRQMTLGGWGEPVKEKEILKGKPTGDTSIGKEIRENPIELFKKLLRAQPGDKVEIRVFWSGNRQKIEESVVLESIKKNKKGKVIRRTKSAIRQIAMLSVKNGIPESINVKKTEQLYGDRVKGEIIFDEKVLKARTKKRKKPLKTKEGSVIKTYFLTDQDYLGAVLSVARELNPKYIRMSLKEIGGDLIKRNSKWVRETKIFGKI